MSKVSVGYIVKKPFYDIEWCRCFGRSLCALFKARPREFVVSGGLVALGPGVVLVGYGFCDRYC